MRFKARLSRKTKAPCCSCLTQILTFFACRHATVKSANPAYTIFALKICILAVAFARSCWLA
jgi:hypothetical protein